ncbi:MAG: OmpA family protein [Rhodospirillaceae bacterium]
MKADLAEVYGFRTRLVEIVSCCGKERTPQVAAKAQVAYDCWVEELEEGWDTDAINMCKNNLLKHLNTMEQACGDPEPREFSIYFDFNSAEITPEGLNIVAEAASFAGATNAIALRGWADTVGDPGYNLKLSQERAEAVRAALVAAGVPAANMVTQAEGETNLPVATGANVRERRNRQVSIFIGQ